MSASASGENVSAISGISVGLPVPAVWKK